MSSNPWPWNVLGLEGRPDDVRDVKRAYARQLKQIDQATEAQKFEQLRSAYDTALSFMRSFAAVEIPTPTPVVNELANDDQPPSEVPTQPHQDTPPDPETLRMTEAFALSAGLSPNMRSVDAEQGFKAILTSPLMDYPQTAAYLKDHIRNTLRQFDAKHQGGALDASVSYDVIMLMEKRFHWLSDVSAVNRDFRFQPGIVDKMLERSGEPVKVIKPDATVRYNRRPNFMWLVFLLPLAKFAVEISALNSGDFGIFVLWGMSGVLLLSFVAMTYAFAQRRLLPATALVFAMLLVGSFPVWLYTAATSAYGLPVFCAEVIVVVGFCIVAAQRRGSLESILQRIVGGPQRFLDRVIGIRR